MHDGLRAICSRSRKAKGGKRAHGFRCTAPLRRLIRRPRMSRAFGDGPRRRGSRRRSTSRKCQACRPVPGTLRRVGRTLETLAVAAWDGIGGRRRPFEFSQVRGIDAQLACEAEHECCRACRGRTDVARSALCHASIKGENRLIKRIVMMALEQGVRVLVCMRDSRVGQVGSAASVDPAVHQICRFGNLPVDVCGAEDLNDGRRKPIDRQRQ